MTTVVAVVLLAALVAYAVLGGADFGAGFWDLTAGPPGKGDAPRELIERSIGPVWEANHVWLIFIFVVTWSAFPSQRYCRKCHQVIERRHGVRRPKYRPVFETGDDSQQPVRLMARSARLENS